MKSLPQFGHCALIGVISALFIVKLFILKTIGNIIPTNMNIGPNTQPISGTKSKPKPIVISQKPQNKPNRIKNRDTINIITGLLYTVRQGLSTRKRVH